MASTSEEASWTLPWPIKMQERINALESSTEESVTKVGNQEIAYIRNRGSEIGGGPSTVVFVAKHGGNIVALKKIMTDKVGKEKEVIKRLMNATKLKHVLVPIKTLEEGETTYYVSKLCAMNLKEVVEENVLPDKKEQMCEQVLEGLKELHGLDVIHRDIKPSNILIDLSGELFLADFGISRPYTGRTATGTERSGSDSWMSKQYLDSLDQNTKFQYSKSADIQVTGFIVYYILTGHHPFEATHPYYNDRLAVNKNIRENKYSLQHLSEDQSHYKSLLEEMVSSKPSRDIEYYLEKFRSLSKGPGSYGDLRSIDTQPESGEDIADVGTVPEGQIDDNSSQSAKPPVSQPQMNPRGGNAYGLMKVGLSAHLTESDCANIHMLRNTPRGEAEINKNGQNLVNYLESKGVYNESNVDGLIGYFEALDLVQLIKIVEDYKSSIQMK